MSRLPGLDRLGRWFVPALLAGLLALVMLAAPISSLVNVMRMPMHCMGVPMPETMAMPLASQRAQAPIIQPLATFPEL